MNPKHTFLTGERRLLSFADTPETRNITAPEGTPEHLVERSQQILKRFEDVQEKMRGKALENEAAGTAGLAREFLEMNRKYASEVKQFGARAWSLKTSLEGREQNLDRLENSLRGFEERAGVESQGSRPKNGSNSLLDRYGEYEALRERAVAMDRRAQEVGRKIYATNPQEFVTFRDAYVQKAHELQKYRIDRNDMDTILNGREEILKDLEQFVLESEKNISVAPAAASAKAPALSRVPLGASAPSRIRSTKPVSKSPDSAVPSSTVPRTPAPVPPKKDVAPGTGRKKDSPKTAPAKPAARPAPAPVPTPAPKATSAPAPAVDVPKAKPKRKPEPKPSVRPAPAPVPTPAPKAKPAPVPVADAPVARPVPDPSVNPEPRMPAPAPDSKPEAKPAPSPTPPATAPRSATAKVPDVLSTEVPNTPDALPRGTAPFEPEKSDAKHPADILITPWNISLSMYVGKVLAGGFGVDDALEKIGVWKQSPDATLKDAVRWAEAEVKAKRLTDLCTALGIMAKDRDLGDGVQPGDRIGIERMLRDVITGAAALGNVSPKAKARAQGILKGLEIASPSGVYNMKQEGETVVLRRVRQAPAKTHALPISEKTPKHSPAIPSATERLTERPAGFAKMPEETRVSELLVQFSGEEKARILKQVMEEQAPPLAVRLGLQQLDLLRSILEAQARDAVNPNANLRKAVLINERFRRLLRIFPTPNLDAGEFLKLKIEAFLRDDMPKVQTAISNDSMTVFEAMHAYPFLGVLIRDIAGLDPTLFLLPDEVFDPEKDKNVKAQKGAEAKVRYEASVFAYLGGEMKDYAAAQTLGEQILHEEFATARKKMDQIMAQKIRMDAGGEVLQKKEQLFTAWQKQGMTEEQCNAFLEAMIEDQTEMALNAEAAKFLETDHLTGPKKEAWDNYSTFFNTKGEHLFSAATWDRIYMEVAINAPLIMVSGGVAGFARAGMSAAARGVVGRTLIRLGAKGVTRRLITQGATIAAGGLAEGTAFLAVHSNLVGEMPKNLPDWVEQIFWTTATLGAFHGLGKWTEHVIKNKPLLETWIKGIKNPLVRVAAVEAAKTAPETACMIVMGALQRGFHEGSLEEFMNAFSMEELFHAFVSVGALKVAGGVVQTAKGTVFRPKGEAAPSVPPAAPEGPSRAERAGRAVRRVGETIAKAGRDLKDKVTGRGREDSSSEEVPAEAPREDASRGEIYLPNPDGSLTRLNTLVRQARRADPATREAIVERLRQSRAEADPEFFPAMDEAILEAQTPSRPVPAPAPMGMPPEAMTPVITPEALTAGGKRVWKWMRDGASRLDPRNMWARGKHEWKRGEEVKVQREDRTMEEGWQVAGKTLEGNIRVVNGRSGKGKVVSPEELHEWNPPASKRPSIVSRIREKLMKRSPSESAARNARMRNWEGSVEELPDRVAQKRCTVDEADEALRIALYGKRGGYDPDVASPHDMQFLRLHEELGRADRLGERYTPFQPAPEATEASGVDEGTSPVETAPERPSIVERFKRWRQETKERGAARRAVKEAASNVRKAMKQLKSVTLEVDGQTYLVGDLPRLVREGKVRYGRARKSFDLQSFGQPVEQNAVNMKAFEALFEADGHVQFKEVSVRSHDGQSRTEYSDELPMLVEQGIITPESAKAAIEELGRQYPGESEKTESLLAQVRESAPRGQHVLELIDQAHQRLEGATVTIGGVRYRAGDLPALVRRGSVTHEDASQALFRDVQTYDSNDMHALWEIGDALDAAFRERVETDAGVESSGPVRDEPVSESGPAENPALRRRVILPKPVSETLPADRPAEASKSAPADSGDVHRPSPEALRVKGENPIVFENGSYGEHDIIVRYSDGSEQLSLKEYLDRVRSDDIGIDEARTFLRGQLSAEDPALRKRIELSLMELGE
ncbi:MAG: hypothetical protein WCS85_03740 [Candidatus Peribacteraceae bacterium]